LHIRKILNFSGQFTARRVVVSLFATLSALSCAQSAFASNITVASPVNGTSVTSPVWVRAHNIGCNGLPPTAFGFSIDSSSTTTMGATPYDIDVSRVGIASGGHTIHFKSWTSAGVCPVVNTSFNVNGGTTTSSSGTSAATSTSIPSYAVGSANLDTVGNWAYEHDGGTPGSSRGSTAYPASTPVYGDARQFYMTYSNRGGERWHVSWGRDGGATHFIFDTYVYITDPGQVANLELDVNQVMSNGKTVIYGTQCSSYSGTWEWTYQTSNQPHWHSSNLRCNPKTWGANSWHHIQIGFHRDSYGTVTHDWVNLDGTHSTFSGATSNAALSLGWAAGSLTLNYQIDGAYSGSGSVNSYVHKMTVYRW
jgi:hypothetical protein